jgi:radical SAM superfamily enzyme YgiQ (UPF0313 family)
MKVLLVYPQYPDTFWSFKHALKFISKKAAFPPLGLLTIAAMLPEKWEKKLVDMNVSKLTDKDIKWADYVFISAMIVQKDSVREIVARCKKLNVKTVAGGPLFTTGFKDFEEIDHLVLNEAEITLPPFLEDLKNGCAKHIYTSSEHPDLAQTPIPLWELINMKNYASMSVQFSRGCPFDCEFCDITAIYGRVPRTKDEVQLLREFDALYERGWRNSVFIVDDNFIGNKIKVKAILLATIKWMKERNYPFSFFTEASLNLADDEELMRLMTDAGFNKVFLGLETPIEESLVECNKFQNRNRDMVASVKKIQNRGLEVFGGFIVGFDHDPLSIFESQINFIQKIGVATAMVGLLTALPGTRLHARLEKEGRLLKDSSGNNTDGSLNFVPKMDSEVLINGYKKLLDTIYSPKKYYERVITFLEEYKPVKRKKKIRFSDIKALTKSMWFLGVVEKSRKYYWKLMAKSLFKYRRSFPEAVTLTIYGSHFRKVVDKDLKR